MTKSRTRVCAMAPLGDKCRLRDEALELTMALEARPDAHKSNDFDLLIKKLKRKQPYATMKSITSHERRIAEFVDAVKAGLKAEGRDTPKALEKVIAKLKSVPLYKDVNSSTLRREWFRYRDSPAPDKRLATEIVLGA
jgi:hypothetical protein